MAINSAGGNWAEMAIIPARQARPVPDDIPDEQAACYFVNPATVLAMARHVLAVPRGEWLLQSAAGSTLGRMLINQGRHDGFKTLNVVRRHEAIAELEKLGGDAVISSSDGPIDEQVRRITGGAGARYAVDPVGGETGTGVFRSLAEGGRVLLYGTLSGEPIEVDPRLVISGPSIPSRGILAWVKMDAKHGRFPQPCSCFAKSAAAPIRLRASCAPRSVASLSVKRNQGGPERPEPSGGRERYFSDSAKPNDRRLQARGRRTATRLRHSRAAADSRGCRFDHSIISTRIS